MKKLIITTMIIGSLAACKAQQQEGMSHMTAQLWLEDINYLDKRIQKEFVSFDPTVKDTFSKNIAELKGNMSQYDNASMAIKLSQLVAGLGDGHTEIQFFGREIGFERLPLSFYFFEEGLYLLASHEAYSEYVGARVLKIGDTPVPEVFRLLKTIMTHDNDYEILHAGPSFIMLPAVLKYLGISPSVSEVAFTMKKEDGTEEVIKVSPKSIDDYAKGPWVRYTELKNLPTPLSATPSEKNHWYKYLPEEKTMYFCYSTTNDQKGHPSIKKVTKALFEEIDRLKPEKLVIDMRRNTGGNYHKSRPMVDAIISRPWLNQKGKIYAISSRRTFSAAKTTSIFLKRETNALLVGEPSRGHPNKSQNVEHFRLPNSQLRIEYTTRVKKHWPELGDADMVPLDHQLPVRFSDYAKGLDTFMAYILKQ